ncbi:hypothetical protein J6590_083072 [Homalodisca vitripennis]|nr:hypothetical protein J6590_083072 [Homalodisca vitripennis]
MPGSGSGAGVTAETFDVSGRGAACWELNGNNSATHEHQQELRAALVQPDIGTQRFEARILRWKQVGNPRAPTVAELILTVLNMHRTKRPSCNKTLAKKSTSSSCRTKFDSVQYARHKANSERPSCIKTLTHKDVTFVSSSSCRTKFDSAQYARHKANFERPSCNQTLANTRTNTRAPAIADLSLRVLNMHGTKRNLSGPPSRQHTSSSSCRTKFDSAQCARNKANFERPSCKKTLAHQRGARIVRWKQFGNTRALSGPRATIHWQKRARDDCILRWKQVGNTEFQQASLVHQNIGKQARDTRILRWKRFGNTRVPAVGELSLTVFNMHDTASLRGPRSTRHWRTRAPPAVAELKLTVLNMHGTKRTLSGPHATRHWNTTVRRSHLEVEATVAELSLTVLNMHGTKRTLSGPRETRHWQTRARDARIVTRKQFGNTRGPAVAELSLTTLAKRARVARILRWKQVGNPRAPAVAKLILTVLNMHRTRQTLSGPCATRHWQKRARDDWILRWKQVGNTRGPAVAELSLTVLNMHGTKRTLNGPRATRHWQTRARDARIVPRKQFSNTRTPAVADLSLRVLNMHGTMRTLSGPRATKHWHTTI